MVERIYDIPILFSNLIKSIFIQRKLLFKKIETIYTTPNNFTFQNFTKWYIWNPEKGILELKKRIRYIKNFFENLNFEIFRQFLTKIHIYSFWHPFYPFSDQGSEYLHFGQIFHKYLLKRPISKKVIKS